MTRGYLWIALLDPIQRRDMMVRCIQSIQNMEGIPTTREDAERAYDLVQKEKETK